jgi:hypothetical protein
VNDSPDRDDDRPGKLAGHTVANLEGKAMGGLSGIVGAIRDGRVISAVSHWIEEEFREWRLRTALKHTGGAVGRLPAIRTRGEFAASQQAGSLKVALDEAIRGNQLPSIVRDIEGMSGQKYRMLINKFIGALHDARYLEVGSWKGSTAAAALHGNCVRAVCIDNWSQFDGPRETFFANIKQVLSSEIEFEVIESDFRSVDYRTIGHFNIFLFDGPHEERDQYDGIMLAQPALDDHLTLIVDDWNWRQVRLGTFRAIVDGRWSVEASIEIRTTRDNTSPKVEGKESDWHNGYFLAVLRKLTGELGSRPS